MENLLKSAIHITNNKSKDKPLFLLLSSSAQPNRRSSAASPSQRAHHCQSFHWSQSGQQFPVAVVVVAAAAAAVASVETACS